MAAPMAAMPRAELVRRAVEPSIGVTPEEVEAQCDTRAADAVPPSHALQTSETGAPLLETLDDATLTLTSSGRAAQMARTSPDENASQRQLQSGNSSPLPEIGVGALAATVKRRPSTLGGSHSHAISSAASHAASFS